MSNFTREDIEVRQLTSGEKLNIPVFRYQGTDPKAPSVYLQASLHGSEIQGNAVIYKLMQLFEEVPPLGNVTLVPLCNPYGANQKAGEYTAGRFDPTTGDNWNRLHYHVTDQAKKNQGALDLNSFVENYQAKSWPEIKDLFKKEMKKNIETKLADSRTWGIHYGKSLCLQLQRLACEHDVVLDLHTGPKATQYLYTPEYAVESALQLGFPHILAIPNSFAGAMDEACFAPWVELKQAFSDSGRKDIPIEFEAFTVELGSQEVMDMEFCDLHFKRIRNYLQKKGTLSGHAELPREPLAVCMLKDYKTIHSSTAGLVDYKVAPGTKVKKGDLLMEILNMDNLHEGNQLNSALAQIHAPEDGIVVFHCSSGSVHSGMELLSLMTNYQLKKA